MKSGYPTRLIAILLALFTLGIIGLAAANLSQDLSFDPPTDGARMTETAGGLLVYSVPTGTPAYRAGIREGDIVVSINSEPTPNLADAIRAIYRSGVLSTAKYSVTRTAADGQKATFPVQVILEPSSDYDRSNHEILRLIALVYLAIGLYVLFRRWTAPKSTHFYVFCLTSFALYALKITGQLDTLDLWVLWCNYIATALQPALFLHFAVSFTDDEKPRPSRHFLYPLLYLPGAVLLIFRYFTQERWSASGQLIHRLDQIDYAYLAIFYLVAAGVFWWRYRREQDPLQRQQLKWLTRGTLLTVLPFTAFYVIPFLSDATAPNNLTRLAVLSLILLPLTFSWAIVRYRLMDVDLIFKRGVTYTLATAALVGLYFGVIALSAEFVHTKFAGLGAWGLIAAVIVTGLLFDPLKRLIQGRVDRVFDQKRFDYRETLVEFGRSLNAQTDLGTLVQSIVERLPQTLLVTRVAVFLADSDEMDENQHFTLVASHGLTHRAAQGEKFDLDFLNFDRRGADSHIFFDSPQAVLRLPQRQRDAAATLDLNYYLPCRASRHEGGGLRTIAVIGLGRTDDGDFLSSEDVELLESLAGYIGIAIQNAQLYRRLQQQITDFERLKDFNENIVESINIGVFAVDLQDRIESWNAQMEVMYALPRAEALRRPLSEVFAADFLDRFDRLRAEQGTSTIYKFRFTTPAGEARTANITIAPLLNRDFQAVGRIVIVDDLTDRMHLEAQLTQAEKLSSIGLLAAGVAHEVNTPLAVISSYTQMLAKQLKADPNSQHLTPVLDKITKQTFRASEIVNGLLNFSRTGSGDIARVDINAMVRDTATLLEHQMRSGRVEIALDLEPNLPAIQGNLGKLQQVLVNLLMNAKDAMQDRGSGRISLATEHRSGIVEIRVADDGAGMSPETLRRIYDPFFTTKSTPKEGQRKGTGLGLAVTYGIMQEHAGKIHVHSAVGEGTEFRLEFPASDLLPTRPTEMESPARTAPKPIAGKAVHV
ncbi:MAG TPA: ATP-binding protein [Acidobacteriaceae bacterium]|nr:ATP-binding protein [Acidobacteriaceae bacterium]